MNNEKFDGFTTGLHYMFAPSGRKGKEYQLFLPLTCVLKAKPQSLDRQDVSMTKQAILKSEPASIEEQQAAILEKCKREADKVKVKGILKLDDRDFDDSMSPETQQEILEKIKQARRQSQDDASPNSDSPRVYQAADQNFSHQNVQHYVHPISYPPILRAGEKELAEVSYI